MNNQPINQFSSGGGNEIRRQQSISPFQTNSQGGFRQGSFGIQPQAQTTNNNSETSANNNSETPANNNSETSANNNSETSASNNTSHAQTNDSSSSKKETSKTNASTTKTNDKNNDANDYQNSFLIQDDEKKTKNPLFIRSSSLIKYAEDFPLDEFKNVFAEYDEDFSNSDFISIMHKTCPEIEKKYPSFLKTSIEWMTISNTRVKFEGIYSKSKIQLTAKSSLTAFYSVFIPQDLSKTESAVEVFANSNATFINCHFYDAPRVAVIARNYSTVTFINCVFNNNKISCFVMDDSLAQFINCKFKNDQNISIFVTKDSQCEMSSCLFKGIAGKAIFAKDSSKVYITNTIFDNCAKGAATIAELSSIFLDDAPKLKSQDEIMKNHSLIEQEEIEELSNEESKTNTDTRIKIIHPDNTALRAINNSQICARSVVIEEAQGNAINIENSYGYFFDCNISKTVHPTIAVIGRKANPIFYNCTLNQNENTFCVISKNCSRPLFVDCTINDCKTNCISVSDFSKPHFQNCTFDKITKSYLNIFSGSSATYANLYPEDQSKITVSPTAKCQCIELLQLYSRDDDEENNNNKADDGEEDEEEDECPTRIKSWRSPSYEVPPDITEMIKPEIIQNKELTPLKPVNIKKIIKEFNNNAAVFICSSCGSNMEKEDKDLHILIPCGHPICDNCKACSNCPICDSPVKEVKKVFKEEDCMICLDKKSNTISLPCAHLCMCYACASKCAEKNFNCPMCNESLNSYKYIFNDYQKKDQAQNDANKE